MIDLSPLRSESLLGKLARLPLRLIPPGAVVPILQGQLRGARWIVGSGVHGCWLGFYESAKQREIAKRVRRGSDVFDVGAHVGFYTLLFSRLAGTQGRVAAFEPNRANLALLRRHLALNDVANVEVVQAAVTSRSGLTRFASGDSSYTGHTSREGDSTVAATPGGSTSCRSTSYPSCSSPLMVQICAPPQWISSERADTTSWG